MTISDTCRAKDPTKCPYHGALLRLENAQKTGNLNDYMATREELVALATKQRQRKLANLFSNQEKVEVPDMVDAAVFTEPKKSAKPTSVVTPALKDADLPPHVQAKLAEIDRITAEVEADTYENSEADDYWDEEERRRREKHREEMEDRVDFLKSSKAVPTPMEAYALWLSIYKTQGGKVQKEIYGDYNTSSTVIGEGNRIAHRGGPVNEDTKFDYGNISWDRWTPTVNGGQIPAGYGSMAMEIFIMPDVTNQRSTPATDDHRKGWEFGHSEVFILRRDDNDPTGIGLIAETNSTRVKSYHDVEKYVRGKSISQLMANLTSIHRAQKLEK